MSAFYVGQKVRKVRGTGNIGLTGTVSGFDQSQSDGCTISWRLDTEFIGMQMNGKKVSIPAGSEAWDNPHHLEPILPAGLESLDRINELYEPEPEVIRV